MEFSQRSAQGSIVGYDHIAETVDNPEPQQDSPSVHLSLGNSLAGCIGDRYVLALVGLPGSGKTYVARRLSQYLQFFQGAVTKVFNVGNYRRDIVGAKSMHDFFDPENQEGTAKRAMVAEVAMNDLKEWLKAGDDRGRVAIYDATNSTRERRSWIVSELKGIIEAKHKLIFLETCIRDEMLLESNIREMKETMPDYADTNQDEAVEDFKKRVEHYRKVYEPLNENDDAKTSWIRIVDGGRSITMNCISGFLPGKMVQFLMNIHTTLRPIYLSRHGQSNYNKLGKIGGDSSLSESGEAYALELAKFVHKEILGLNEDGSFLDEKNRTAVHARLYTSSLRRTKMTARHIVHAQCDDGWITMRPRVCPALDEIFAGAFDGMTYAEIQEKAPAEFNQRKEDKLGYRYPRGESYLDVIQRLDTMIHEVERQKDPILIVGHQGILRIFYSYFVGESREQAPFVSIPLNTIIKLEPQTYSCKVTRIKLNPTGDNTSEDEPPSH
mmetsp:Transcript_42295/g.67728  ORF Transcript_42295/g.67728 Transcript_42295/m.67728 type:complete len:496 (-) Transcript_42295:2268-3755(-)